MASYEDLVVWRKAHELVLSVYALTKGFPVQERYAVTDQLQRAAVSVPANIAEGYAFGSDRVFVRHLAIAQGSLAETRYFLLLSRDLQYVTAAQYEPVSAQAAEVSRLLTAFRRKVEARAYQQAVPPSVAVSEPDA